MMEQQTLHGRGVSSGFALGPLVVLSHGNSDKNSSDKNSSNKPDLQFQDTAAELARLDLAVKAVRRRLLGLVEKTRHELGEESAEIFEAHIMMLDDPEFLGPVHAYIESRSVVVEQALKQVSGELQSTFSQMDDEYLRERALDIRDLTEQLLTQLSGADNHFWLNLREPVILAGYDLTPSQVASVPRDKILGFLAEVGGETSHAAILARILEVPFITGIKDLHTVLENSKHVFVDGSTGRLVLNPQDEIKADFLDNQQKEWAQKQERLKLRDEICRTQDGYLVTLEGNIGTSADLAALENYGVNGVGLFRTEFLFLDRAKAPSETEQYQIYAEVLRHQNPHRVTIRTLDVGGDKQIPFLKITKEANPFLGLRAVRYCLRDVPIFKTQLRALLKASHHGQLAIMFPMINSISEIMACRALLAECEAELLHEGWREQMSYKFGIMIETPAAALTADLMAKHVDFFSIGTNDLIQYICAADRMNDAIQDLYDPYHPAVLRAISMVVNAAHKYGVHVGVCGDLAGHPYLAPILIGLGVQHLSMVPAQTLQMKMIFANCDMSKLISWSQHVLGLPESENIREYLQNMLR